MWDAVQRLATVGAVALRVEPPDTAGGTATERVLAIAGEPPTLLERATLFKRRGRRRELYEALESLGGSALVRHVVEQLGFGEAVIRGLASQGLVAVTTAERVRDPFEDSPATPPPETLTPAQLDALRAIESLGPGDGALLFGVTGSGKTLVYLEAVKRALDRGRGAIVLVPEIGLTPQAVSRLRGAFGDQVAVLHSALSDGERADAWRLLRRGERKVAVGARSAIFAPVQDLGVIVVDEEHEASYKNGETPRYLTRDVAAVRARLEGASLVFGSATPSLETMARTADRLKLLRLPERIGSRPMPPVEIVDLRVAPKVTGTGSVAWSTALDDAIVAALARGEQTLLLLNRRGYAAFLQCPDCGEVWQCPRCTISLTVHRAPPALRCHYCGHEEPLPFTCRACANPVQQMRGVGTQQLEQMLAERYPRARVAQDGPRHHQHQVVAPADPRRGGAGRGGSADRHPDDRQGPRLPQRHPGRRGRCRHRSLPARLSLRRAHLPAPGPGGRPRRPRPQGRPGDRADPPPAAPRLGPGRATRRRGLPRRGAGPPPRAARIRPSSRWSIWSCQAPARPKPPAAPPRSPTGATLWSLATRSR